MKKLIVSICLALTGTFSFAGEKLTADQFLNIVRMPPGRESWASMDGKIRHKRSGKSTSYSPLYLGIKFGIDRTLAQIVIDKSEGYTVGQAYSASEDSTTILPMSMNIKPEDSKLGNVGLSPEDLAMTFLYWDFQKELEEDSIKLQDCRVFLLKRPNSTEKQNLVKVYISEDYFFPLKVEWYEKSYEEGKEIRTLQIKEFEKRQNSESNDKEGSFWLVTALEIYGKGWTSSIQFNNTKAGLSENGIPKDLFVDIN